MNLDQIGGIIRTILAALGGLAVTAGYVDSNTETAIVGALTTLAVAGWSAWTNKPGTVIAK